MHRTFVALASLALMVLAAWLVLWLAANGRPLAKTLAPATLAGSAVPRSTDIAASTSITLTARSDATEDVNKPTIDVAEVARLAVPFPRSSPTPCDPSTGHYVGWSAADVAATVVPRLELDGLADPPTRIVAAEDLYVDSAQSVVEPSAIAVCGVPFVAAVLEGLFYPLIVWRHPPTRYATFAVDRVTGHIVAQSRSDSLDILLRALPSR